MSALDWLVILAYLAVMLYIGYHSMKTVKTDEDFVLAGRNVGNIYIILSLFASFTGLSGLFGTPQYVYEYGIAGWWWWATFPIGVFIMGMTMAKLLRRRMHVTLPDVVDVNHSSKAVRVAASLVTVWNYLAWTAGQVAGIVLVITTFTDLNGTAAVIVAYIIIVLFTLLGGFRAVVYTDSLQAVLFLVVLGLVIPAVLLLHYDVPEALAQTTSIDGFYKLFGSVPAGTMITWWLLAPAGFIDNMALQRVFAAKDEKSAKGNITAAFLLMIIFGLILMFIGIMARFILPAGSDPASAMLNLSQLVLPKGMLGLLVAAFAGVAVSTASSTLLVCSSTLEQDVYSVLRNTGKEKPASSLLVNRLFVVLVGLIALVLALKVPSVTQILMYGYSVYVPGLLLPVIAGSFHWKLSDRAMLLTIVSGVLTAVILILMGEPFPGSLGGLIVSAIPFCIGLWNGRQRAEVH
ncbi:sodium:solute symporter family protein [Clostridium sp. DFI.5.61]|uniref:sodium:solute symporter family protein n=2 Tax=Clostridia TaxID=186801 RepID=UPI000D28F2D2|nr:MULTISPECIES: sodium:solute symporter family protein [Eubacteriales]MCB5925605.1 sodium:solute symporter family protein [bacterium 210820-DFI.5.26]MCQ5160158.1 sodium:solute symporter family protein [Clostridium sp. DFI.5.61]UMM46329.1 sodium:solute symporter family protein [Lawsonibacter asaccharolyticus]GBF69443.1 Na+solute symporter [Lawsonibacter asaccharolyticus]